MEKKLKNKPTGIQSNTFSCALWTQERKIATPKAVEEFEGVLKEHGVNSLGHAFAQAGLGRPAVIDYLKKYGIYLVPKEYDNSSYSRVCGMLEIAFRTAEGKLQATGTSVVTEDQTHVVEKVPNWDGINWDDLQCARVPDNNTDRLQI